MTQWYAVCYKTGPQKDDVRSYGTVITGDDPNGPPFDDSTYYKVAIDHQPGAEEKWDKAAKAVVPNLVAIAERIKRETAIARREELKEIRSQRPWTNDEFQEAIANML